MIKKHITFDAVALDYLRKHASGKFGKLSMLVNNACRSYYKIPYPILVGICEDCGSEKGLMRHHVSYDPEIIKIVCYKCHEKIVSSGKHPPMPKDWKYKHKTYIMFEEHIIDFLKSKVKKRGDFSYLVNKACIKYYKINGAKF